MGFRTTIQLLSLCGGLALTGCESLRLHDPGRLKVAQEAAEIAADLTAKGGAVFGPMEENLDGVNKIQVDLQKRVRDHELNTYKEVLARQSPEKIGKMFLDVMRTREANFQMLKAQEAAAAASVNAALDRQSLVSTVIKGEAEKELAQAQQELGAAVAAGNPENEDKLKERVATLTDLVAAENSGATRSLHQTLKRTKRWLDWIDKGLARFEKAHAALEGLSHSGAISGEMTTALGNISDDTSANAAVVSGLVEDAQQALDQVERDPNVQAAQLLLRAAMQQTAAAEQERLVEFRRNLGEIKRLGERLRVRDQVAVCNLYVPALGAVFPAIADITLRQDITNVTAGLANSGRYKTGSKPSCLPDLSGMQPIAARRSQWGSPPNPLRLNVYVASALNAANANPNDRQTVAQAKLATRLVGAVGVLVFYERFLVDNTINEMASEQHLHSIRLSRINAGQRADLVNQLAQGLEIYYQGSVKPEEMAQLLLLATQAGGIFFVGSQL
jgi:hypothetical protein